jgi:hypothetical protein
MSEHLSEEQIERYRAQTLAPAEKLLVARHLAVCNQCNVRPRLMASSPAAFAALRKNLRPRAREDLHHLDYELMEAYVDERADAIDTEIVESHIELCADCAAELKELHTFALTMRPQAARKVAAPPPAPSLWSRIRAGLRVSSGSAAWRVAGAAAAVSLLVMLAAIVFMIYRFSLTGDRGEIAEINNAASPAGQKASINSNRDNTNTSPPNNNTVIAEVHPPKAAPYVIDLPLSRGAGEGEVYRVPPDSDSVMFRVRVGNETHRTSRGRGTGTQPDIGSDKKSKGRGTGTIDIPSRLNIETSQKYEGRLVRPNGSAIPLGIVRVTRDGKVAFSAQAAKLAPGDYALKIYRAPRTGSEDDEVASIPLQIRK